MNNDATFASQVQQIRRPVERAYTLPPSCYTSADWYQKEIEQVFRKEWLCVGREERVAHKGDYFTVDIADDPVIVTRDNKNTVRAFSNVCRHRGAKIMTGAGNTKTLVCGYHCWTYTLAGDLIVVPGHPDPMSGADDFDRKQFGLVPIRIEAWAGFLFITLSSTTPPLMEWLGDLPEFLRNYRLEDMKIHRELDFNVDVNWKVFVENTMESYHAGFVHAKFLSPDVDQGWKFLETAGPYEAMYSDKSIMDFGNLPPMAGLDEKQTRGLFHIWIRPNLTLHVSSTYMTFRQYLPREAEKMQIFYTWCFKQETMAHESFEPVSVDYYAKSEEILHEDIAFIPRVQTGLRSRAAAPGRYSPSEFIVHRIGRYVVDQIVAPTEADGSQVAAG